jgi:hypothetical protein
MGNAGESAMCRLPYVRSSEVGDLSVRGLARREGGCYKERE